MCQGFDAHMLAVAAQPCLPGQHTDRDVSGTKSIIQEADLWVLLYSLKQKFSSVFIQGFTVCICPASTETCCITASTAILNVTSIAMGLDWLILLCKLISVCDGRISTCIHHRPQNRSTPSFVCKTAPLSDLPKHQAVLTSSRLAVLTNA